MVSKEHSVTLILKASMCFCVRIYVGIFMHLYKILSDADKIHPKEEVMVFPPFVLEEGKIFFSAHKCSPVPNAITFKMCSPTQMRIASYFSPLGTASFSFEGLSLQVQSLPLTASM